jgi:hypothetical protein
MEAAIAVLASAPSTARFADALRLWSDAGDAVTLEACLGLAPTWRSARRRRRHDRLLRQIAAEHFPALRGRPSANALARAIVDYEARCWPRHRRSGNRRPGLPGALFQLLMLGRPLGADGIRGVVKITTRD